MEAKARCSIHAELQRGLLVLKVRAAAFGKGLHALAAVFGGKGGVEQALLQMQTFAQTQLLCCSPRKGGKKVWQ